MLPLYSNLIIEVFKLKKANKKLENCWTRPTPKSVKEECRRVCFERYSTADQGALREFFGKAGTKEETLKSIDAIDIDRFRPVINLIKGQTSNPESKNVELLAWLINFQPRPFDYTSEFSRKLEELELRIKNGELFKEEMPVEQEKKEEEKLTTTQLDISDTRTNYTLPAKKHFKLPGRNWLIGLGLVSVTGIGAIWKFNPSNGAIPKAETKNTTCLYWNGYEYKNIPCSTSGDTILIPFKPELLDFKRITTPDTITVLSIGKVHYSKKNKVLEYFTTDGKHPEDTARKLRPLSRYMYDKYLRPKKTPAGK
jgi:hypothetical protein